MVSAFRTVVSGVLGAIGSIGLAGPATAAGDSVSLELVGSVEPRCAFVAAPTSAGLGALAAGALVDLGKLSFRCNLPDSPTVHLTVQSQHGALRRDGGSESIPYAAQWNVPGGGALVDAASFVSPLDFTLPAGDIVAGQGGSFKVTLGGSGAPVAGIYRDRITYTISP